MIDQDTYKLDGFLPYLMTQAADALSSEFQRYYKEKYGMLRTEWRVLFHLGSFGDLTAKEICERANIHKTKVSRAVTALNAKGYVSRETVKSDRRHSLLKLSEQGHTVFLDLRRQAQSFDAKIKSKLNADDLRVLETLLRKFIADQPK